ncbi:sialin-like isoform X2 [Lycorma delicatula]|uniref:sialin-like isoform X2 n=1 Tax=Lycorma delicatula TaxID=130591 RepID=UPI003F51244B
MNDPKEKEFEFSSNFRGVVLSSYYYGTICSFIIGGCLATRYGGRVVLIITAFMGSFLTIAIPELSKINAYFIVVLRALLGSCMGMVFPAMNEIWSKWAPIYERTSLASFAISGCFFGNVYTSASAGYIAKYLGWPAVFYITGLFSLIWAIVCGKIIKNDPAHDKYISNEELEYIKNSTKQITSEKVIVPWRKMLTSTPVWAVIVTHFCGNWGMFTLLTELPTFLHEVWQYDIKSVGYLSALPYIANSASLLISGQLADKLLKSELLTKTCKDYEQWKYVFINTGFIYVVGAIFYGIFGSAELQHWAKSGDDSTETINA